MHLTTVNRVDPVVGASPMLAHKEMPVGLRNRRVCVYIDFEPYNPNKSYKERKMFFIMFIARIYRTQLMRRPQRALSTCLPLSGIWQC